MGLGFLCVAFGSVIFRLQVWNGKKRGLEDDAYVDL